MKLLICYEKFMDVNTAIFTFSVIYRHSAA